jgi:hypothetical protein
MVAANLIIASNSKEYFNILIKETKMYQEILLSILRHEHGMPKQTYILFMRLLKQEESRAKFSNISGRDLQECFAILENVYHNGYGYVECAP